MDLVYCYKVAIVTQYKTMIAPEGGIVAFVTQQLLLHSGFCYK